MRSTEIIFEITEAIEGWCDRAQHGDSLEEIRRDIKEAVNCYFDDTMPWPKLIRLYFVRDEVLLA
ncbi:MAG: hypothetical protein OXF47_07620 [Nitrospira sp.]|nr:hypothetical protein [Nitrospira sp.]